MNYRGSCHCAKVAFEVEGEIDSAMSCNCSMCRRKGSLLWFVPRDRLRLLTPEDNASTYLFNKHAIEHRFCPTCGIHPYAEATDPDGNRMAAVNVRCLKTSTSRRCPSRSSTGVRSRAATATATASAPGVRRIARGAVDLGRRVDARCPMPDARCARSCAPQCAVAA